MPENHLPQVSLTPTIERQTPKRDFTDVMGRAVASVASVGADLLAPVAASHPLLSAAVSGIKSVAQSALVQAAGVRVGSGPASVGGAAPGAGSDAASMLDANRQSMQESMQMNLAYLQLQRDMQAESQQFNAVSNIMKVRHDSAKAAINNIR